MASPTGRDDATFATETCVQSATYSRVAPLLSLGVRRRLEESDLPDLLRMDAVDPLSEALERSAPGEPLWWRLYLAMSDHVSLAALAAATHGACSVALPLAMRLLVDGVQSGDERSPWYAVLLFSLQLVGTACSQHAQGIGFRLGQRARAALVTLIFRASASLREGEWAAIGSSQGAVTTMLSSDTTKLYELGPFMHAVWVAPAMIVAACSLLVVAIGPGGLVALAVLLLLVPLSASISRAVQHARQQHLLVTDARLRATSEFLGSVKTSKLYGWERAWRDRIGTLRADEVRWMFRENAFFGLAVAVLIMGPVLAALSAFATFTLGGGQLSSGLAFQTLGLVSVLRFPLQQMANAMTSAAHAGVALARIDAFLAAVARVTGGRDDKAAAGDKPVGIDIAPVLYRWPTSSDEAAANAAAAEARDASAGGREGFSVSLGAGLAVLPGQLTLVCGRVASGKSTLLAGLLGETLAEALPSPGGGSPGPLSLRSGCSFAAQTAFLLSSSVRDNILFGLPFHEGRYRRAVWAACLAEDLRELPAGDATAVGEEGLVTSGGQRARIALARALFAEAPVCVADDVISALDAGTATKVARRALGPSGVLRGTARLLATHAVHLGPMASQVVALDGGRVVYQGPWEGFAGTAAHRDLLEAEAAETRVRAASDAASSVGAEGVTAEDAGVHAAEAEEAEAADADAAACARDPDDRDAPWWGVDLSGGRGSAGGLGPSGEAPPAKAGGEAAGVVGASLMTEEVRERGRTSCASICLWLRGAGGWWWAVVLVLALATERCSYVSVDVWLANWATQADVAAGRESASAAASATVQLGLPAVDGDTASSVYLAGYAGLVAFTTAAVLIRTLLFPLVCWLAASTSFRWVVWSVLRAPFVFFETTPRGRILSRLSYDVEIVDFVLQTKLQPAVASLGWLASGIGVLAGVLPWMAVAFLPIGVAWAWLQQHFSHAVRDLQRLDNATRSPIQTHFGETLSGAATIRAYGQLGRFERRAAQLVNANSRAVCSFIDANRWMGLRVDALGCVVLLAAGLLSWAVRDTLTGGLVGLAVLWSANMTVSLNFAIIYTTELEARLTSVERVAEYITSVPREPALGGDGSGDADWDPPAPGCLDCACACPRRQRTGSPAKPAPAASPPRGWPAAGAVAFDDVVMRYRPELEPALRGLSLRVEPGQRVGIVGKTGSGKSTTLAALFRSVEPDSGSITVDGVSIAALGLSHVRGAQGGLVIIPQEPCLFAGALRESLDPFGAFPPDRVWASLCQAGLGRLLLHMADGRAARADVSVSSMLGPSAEAEAAEAGRVAAALDLRVEDGGSNFSAGTRQLVCLARALLREPRVLVLDEATASVDPATDQLFQRVLRTRFAGTTCLIVAHRLDTIMDCDAICVVSAGRAAELGPPLDLLADEASHFHALVHARGHNEADRLAELARRSCTPAPAVE